MEVKDKCMNTEVNKYREVSIIAYCIALLNEKCVSWGWTFD